MPKLTIAKDGNDSPTGYIEPYHSPTRQFLELFKVTMTATT